MKFIFTSLTRKNIENSACEKYSVLKPYYARNHLRWHWFGIWANQKEYYYDVLDWITARIEWLDTAL